MIHAKGFTVWDSDDDMAIEFKHDGVSSFVRLSEQHAAALADRLDRTTKARYEKRMTAPARRDQD